MTPCCASSRHRKRQLTPYPLTHMCRFREFARMLPGHGSGNRSSAQRQRHTMYAEGRTVGEQGSDGSGAHKNFVPDGVLLNCNREGGNRGAHNKRPGSE